MRRSDHFWSNLYRDSKTVESHLFYLICRSITTAVSSIGGGVSLMVKEHDTCNSAKITTMDCSTVEIADGEVQQEI